MASPVPPSSSSSSSAAGASGAVAAAVGGGAGASSTLSSSRSRFPTETFHPNLRSLLTTRLSTVTWDRSASPESKAAQRALTRDLAQQVKSKMLELEPRGFKYVVQVQLVENLGQGGRADLSCHWEDSDGVVQDLFSNDSIICTVSAFAIRV